MVQSERKMKPKTGEERENEINARKKKIKGHMSKNENNQINRENGRVKNKGKYLP